MSPQSVQAAVLEAIGAEAPGGWWDMGGEMAGIVLEHWVKQTMEGHQVEPPEFPERKRQLVDVCQAGIAALEGSGVVGGTVDDVPGRSYVTVNLPGQEPVVLNSMSTVAEVLAPFDRAASRLVPATA